MKKILSSFLILSALTLTLTSCSDDDDAPVYLPALASVTFNTNPAIQYSSTNGAWINCLNPTTTTSLTYTGLNFSHQVTTYDGGATYYWSGFCPSNSSENAKHPNDYLDYQWSSITAGGLRASNGTTLPFMVANWNSSEPLDAIPAEPSLKMMAANGKSYRPFRVTVTNSSYTYYSMSDGIGYFGPELEKFTSPNDFLKVYFIGVRNGYKTGTVTVNLATGTQPINQWVAVDLQNLGEVDYIYCQMESSKANQYGMLTPAYFVIGDVVVFAE